MHITKVELIAGLPFYLDNQKPRIGAAQATENSQTQICPTHLSPSGVTRTKPK